MIESHEVVRNNGAKSCVLSTQFSLMVISCKTGEQYHTQDIAIDTVPSPQGCLVKILSFGNCITSKASS